MTRLKRIPKTGIPKMPEGAILMTGYRNSSDSWVMGEMWGSDDTHYCFILPPDGEADLRHEFETKLANHATLSRSNFELSPDNTYLYPVVENLYQAFKLGRKA